MEPSKKSAPLTGFLEKTFGRSTAIKENVCINPPIGCGKPVDIYAMDELTRREYAISGLCADCQELVFGSHGE